MSGMVALATPDRRLRRNVIFTNYKAAYCCTFLAEMMEKYGLEVLRDIVVELQLEPETWRY